MKHNFRFWVSEDVGEHRSFPAIELRIPFFLDEKGVY